MKHSLKVTLVLISLFMISQVFGLITVDKFIEPSVNKTTGATYIEHPNTIIGEIPKVEEKEKSYSFIPLITTVLLGTLFFFLLIKLKAEFVFKYWFLGAIFFTLLISFGVYLPWFPALLFAFIFALWKVYKQNVIIQNLTEIFVYTGIAVAFSAFLNIVSAFFLLLAISVYDMIAVWKSKHMIKLAKFQAKSKVFAGLLIPYSLKKMKKIPKGVKLRKGQKIATAILGGGDIAFPLLFSSAAMQHFIIKWGVGSMNALLYSFVIAVFTTIALTFLFLKGKKDRFYPAMPFLTIGCLAGYLAVMVINLFV